MGWFEAHTRKFKMGQVARSMHDLRRAFVCVNLIFSFILLVFLVVDFEETWEMVSGADSEKLVFSEANTTGVARKLLASADDGDMNRIGATCSKDDIVLFQGPTTPLPNGIPTYTVQILNVCVSGCTISNIHLTCGWFSSARLINPRLFRRLCYDDCLVNDGDALGPGESLSFQYANSFQYPLSVSTVTC